MKNVTINDPGKLVLIVLVVVSPIGAKLAGVLSQGDAGELFKLAIVAVLGYLFGNGRVAVNSTPEKGGTGLTSPVLGPRDPG